MMHEPTAFIDGCRTISGTYQSIERPSHGTRYPMQPRLIKSRSVPAGSADSGDERFRGSGGRTIADLAITHFHDTPHAVGAADNVDSDERQAHRADQRGEPGQVHVGRRQVRGRIRDAR
jgi:hypothetical protein